jgi:hypothetical protein
MPKSRASFAVNPSGALTGTGPDRSRDDINLIKAVTVKVGYEYIRNGILVLEYFGVIVFKALSADSDRAEAPADRVGFRNDDRFTGPCPILFGHIGRDILVVRAGCQPRY